MNTLLFFFMAGLTPAMVPATAADPVFTTYAAPLHRSEYLLDEGYHLRFYSPADPLAFTTDTAGDWGLSFEAGGREVRAIADYAAPPRIEGSLSSLARLAFQPAAGLDAKVTFAVWSSRAAALDLTITNASREPARGAVLLWYRRPEGSRGSFERVRRGVAFSHAEPPANLSETPPAGFTGRFRDLLAGDPKPDGVDSSDREASLRFVFDLAPGKARRFRFVRAVAREEASVESLEATAHQALRKSEEDLIEDASKPYRAAYDPGLTNPARRLIYWSALDLVRQCMLPGEGRVRYNYYVFSREPTWGWGHDGQVFHESLSMLAYALFDGRSAMDSQRIFMEAQDGDGYIPYRIGPYVVRTFPVNGERTSSAPFLSWTNWEVYRTARDLRRKGVGNVEPEEARRFLREALGAGESFMRFWMDHRDTDHDGLFEWGGNAVLESVRDSQVPIWDLLGKDDPTAPSLVEALDLNSMLAAARGRARREDQRDDVGPRHALLLQRRPRDQHLYGEDRGRRDDRPAAQGDHRLPAPLGGHRAAGPRSGSRAAPHEPVRVLAAVRGSHALRRRPGLRARGHAVLPVERRRLAGVELPRFRRPSPLRLQARGARAGGADDRGRRDAVAAQPPVLGVLQSRR